MSPLQTTHNNRLALGSYAFIEATHVFLGEYVADLEVAVGLIAVDIKIIDGVFELRFGQPEHPYAFIIVVFS